MVLSKRAEAVIVPIIFTIIFFVGIIGNGTLVFIVSRVKTLRNAPNILIVSLALGDLALLLVSVPFTATIYTFENWPYGTVVCKLNAFLQGFSVGVSVFTLVALSSDRYIAIVHPMQRHSGSNMKRTLIIAAVIWIFSAVLAIPDAIAPRVYTHGHGLKVCQELPNFWEGTYPKYMVATRFVVYFAFPLIIIGAFYVMIARILVLSSRQMPGDGGALTSCSMQHQRQTEARKKVAKLVLSFVIIFVICWLPRHVYQLWFYFLPGKYNMFWHVFKITGFCLCFINSCVNPLALYLLSKQFRRHYNAALCCMCTKRVGSTRLDQSTMYNYHTEDTGRTQTSLTMSMLPSKSINTIETH